MITNNAATKAFQKCFRELRRSGLLLLADNKLPSITTFVVGKPISGSWWGHPKGHDIFRVACRIADHPDVAVTKLISGKVTFVHRKLWSALLAIGISQESWQMNGLSRKARSLLQIVNRVGEMRTDRLSTFSKAKESSWREAARQLEDRLLIYAEEFHSESGAHAKRLESWKHWAKRVGLDPGTMNREEAKLLLMDQAQKIARKSMSGAKLPWLKK